jgi:hypothetical protein
MKELKFGLQLFILLVSLSGFAGVSAKRRPNEDYLEARARHARDAASLMAVRPGSPLAMAEELESLSFSQVPELPSIRDLNEVFSFFRDTKFLTQVPGPLSERRLSWLYPDDGCFVRASLATYFAQTNRWPEPYKLFVFGNLSVKSPNHPSGVVSWWYHVVPVYRVGQQAYAMDPAIEPRRPLTVEEWKKSVEVTGPVHQFSVCAPATFDPDDNCLNPRGASFGSLIRWQKMFLDQEWSRLLELDRDPRSELGDKPPWR